MTTKYERGLARRTAVLGPDFVPIKSACFFCPASKVWELFWLAGYHPDLLERNALTGNHAVDEFVAAHAEEAVQRRVHAVFPAQQKIAVFKKNAFEAEVTDYFVDGEKVLLVKFCVSRLLLK